MSFKVSIADVEAAVKAESQAAQGWTQAANDVMSALQGLCGLACMQGAAADAVRSRVLECLVPVAQSALLLASEYSARLLIYQDAWHTAEPDASALLPEHDMEELENNLRSWRNVITSDADDVASAARSVGDLVALPIPSDNDLLASYEDSEASAKDSREKCGTAEAKGSDAFGEVEQFVAALDAYVSRVESSTASGFVPGQPASSPEGQALSMQCEASMTRVKQMQPQIEEAAQREQDYFQRRADEEAARQREEQGWWQVVGGVVAGAVGVGAIVLTAGMATPVVVGAAVAGTAAFAYGASEVAEGSQNVYYGSVGDIESLAFNPLRDTVFGGDQASYDLFGQVATTASGLFMAGGASALTAGVKGASLSTQMASLGRGAVGSVVEDAVTGFAGDRVSDVASLFMDKKDADKLGMGAAFVLGMVAPGGSDAARASKLADGATDAARVAGKLDDLADAGRVAGKLDNLADDMAKLPGKLDNLADGAADAGRVAAKMDDLADGAADASRVAGKLDELADDAAKLPDKFGNLADNAADAGRAADKLDGLADNADQFAALGQKGDDLKRTLDDAGDFAHDTAKAGAASHVTFATKGDVPSDFRGIYADADGRLYLKIDSLEFKVNLKAKYKPKELDRQLQGQQDGLRKLTIKEFLENRAAYKANGRGSASKAAQQSARSYALTKKVEELRDSGLPYDEAKAQAAAWMKGKSALHEPDMIAGGRADGLQALTGKYSDKNYGMGDRGANSSIGAQWRNGRADSLEDSIREAIKEIDSDDLDKIYIDVDLNIGNWSHN